MAALPGSEDARLPACCRRLGAHHCAMMLEMMRAGSGAPSFSAPSTCPNYPGASNAVLGASFAVLPAQAATPSPITRISTSLLDFLRHDNILDRTRSGRGPPASFVS